MSQQQAPRVIIIAFIFSVAFIYIAITSLVDRQKVNLAKAAKVTNSIEPNFPVPTIPNTRAEQING
jgi:NADH-quinone oxidoreductase subunit H